MRRAGVILVGAFVACGGQVVPTGEHDGSSSDGALVQPDGDAAPDSPTGLCMESIAQACADPKHFLAGDPCHTSPNNFAIDWQATQTQCTLRECGSYITITLEGPPDSDVLSYVFDATTGALVVISVDSWSMERDYCLAGPTEPVPVTNECSSRSCNTPCSVTPSDCTFDFNAYHRECGPMTTVTACNGAQEVFSQCDCTGTAWWCMSNDGGTTGFTPCDAGAD